MIRKLTWTECNQAASANAMICSTPAALCTRVHKGRTKTDDIWNRRQSKLWNPSQTGRGRKGRKILSTAVRTAEWFYCTQNVESVKTHVVHCTLFLKASLETFAQKLFLKESEIRGKCHEWWPILEVKYCTSSTAASLQRRGKWFIESVFEKIMTSIQDKTHTLRTR